MPEEDNSANKGWRRAQPASLSAQEQESEPGGGTGDQARGRGSAFPASFGEPLGGGGTLGGAAGRQAALREEPHTPSFNRSSLDFNPTLHFLPPTALHQQKSAAQNKSLRITCLGTGPSEGTTRSL